MQQRQPSDAETHIVIMDKGKILKDCGLDTLQEEYCRVTVTALGGLLPQSLPFRDVVDCKRNGSQASLVLRNADAASVMQLAEQLACRAEIRRLDLEELYALVLKQ